MLPTTTTRQAVLLLDANGQLIDVNDAWRVLYDPVARTVTLVPPPGALIEGQPYKIQLRIPPDDNDDSQGLRAIDRATLDPNQPLEIAFFVGPKSNVGVGEPRVSFCADVMPIIQAKCGGSDCHGSSRSPAAALILTTTEGVRRTAIRRVAQGANTAGVAGSGLAPGRVFGVNMPLVQPGSPGESWLLYKVELAPPPALPSNDKPTVVCTPPAGAPPIPPPAPDYAPLAPARLNVDDRERDVLNDHVLGREMPYPVGRVSQGSYFVQPLTFAEREKIRLWIAQGAELQECGGCAMFDAADRDGGADAASDASADGASEPADAASDASADASGG